MDEMIEHFGATGRYLGLDKIAESWTYKPKVTITESEWKNKMSRPMPCGDYYPDWQSLENRTRVNENNS